MISRADFELGNPRRNDWMCTRRRGEEIGPLLRKEIKAFHEKPMILDQRA
jgi:hypothetical protein